MSQFSPVLDEDQLEQLGLFLEKEYQQRDALDFFGAHGFMTALTLGPKHYTIDQIIEGIFEVPPEYSSKDEESQIVQLLKSLHREIRDILDTGDPFYVPCDLLLDGDEDEPAAIEHWAAGFVEATFLQEEEWFQTDQEGEQKVAELMIPLFYASGMFMEEPEMQDIENDEKMEESVLNSIPDVVSELYLHFHGDEN